MENSNLKIEKLRDADNWQQWKFVIEVLLDDEDMLEVCNGNMVKPEANMAEYERKLRTWTKANKKAKRLIVTTLESEPLKLIMNCETAYEMWQKLCGVYDLKSEESLSLTQKKFYEFQWDTSTNVATNFSKVEQLVRKMKALGGEIQDSMVISRILSTLPSTYQHFHSAWDSTEAAKKTIQNLMTRLITEEMRVEPNNSKKSTVALLTKTKASQPGRRSVNKKQTAGAQRNENKLKTNKCFSCGRTEHKEKDCRGCYSCGKKGHFARNCPNNEKKSEKDPKESVSFMVNTSNIINEYWLIDSGASQHMSPRSDWFVDIQYFETSQPVQVSDGRHVMALGKGSINIEARAQGKWTPRTLHDVLYVPKLHANLFSVKTVANKGIDHAITNYGTQCTFTKDGIIVAECVEYGTMYRLDARVLLPRNANAVNKTQIHYNYGMNG